MKKWVFLLIISLSCGCAEEKGRLQKKEGIYFLELEGTHYEMGYQHVTSFRNGVFYVWQFIKRFLSDEFITLLKEKGFISRLEKSTPPEVLEELRGMVDGSEGVLNYDVLILASYGMYFVENLMFNRKLPMCSGFVAFGDATSGGLLINARNMDWMPMEMLLKYPAVIRYKPEEGNSFISIGYPSMVGVISGMNEKGIAVSLLASSSTDCSWEGVDITLILREIMEKADTIGEAEEILINSRNATGCNILISSGKEKTGSVVEMSASKRFVRRPENSMIWVANHYLNQELARTQTGWEGDIEWSLWRYGALGNLLEESYGSIEVETAKKIMETYPVGNTFTVHTIIYLPEKLKVLVKMRGALEKYVEFPVK